MARLPVERRTATLVAFIHSLEASAHDDAFDVLSMLLRDLFARAEQADRMARLRTLKDLDQAALTLAEACRMLPIADTRPSLSEPMLRPLRTATESLRPRAKSLS